jgi:predicted GNAT family acetyltransferase
VRHDASVPDLPSLRSLVAHDLPALRALIARDPVRHVFVESRLRGSGMEPWRLGGELWGYFSDDGQRLTAACYAGPNLIPVEAHDAALFAFADRARAQGRRCSSIVGPADEVGELWRHLQHAWGPARDLRMRQPVMVIDGPALVAPDPLVRPVREDEVDILLPAAAAMFTEEVGVPPTVGDSMTAYRGRLLELIRAGRSFARIEDGRVVFKAEVGATSDLACQVQGVWVEPSLRGRGLAAPGMAAVAELARERIAPTVSLYVNDYNQPALATYRRVGFRVVDTFASILF